MLISRLTTLVAFTESHSKQITKAAPAIKIHVGPSEVLGGGLGDSARRALPISIPLSILASGDRNVQIQPLEAGGRRTRGAIGSIRACGHKVERTIIRSNERRERHGAGRIDLRAEVRGRSPRICRVFARRYPNIHRTEIPVTIAREIK